MNEDLERRNAIIEKWQIQISPIELEVFEIEDDLKWKEKELLEAVLVGQLPIQNKIDHIRLMRCKVLVLKNQVRDMDAQMDQELKEDAEQLLTKLTEEVNTKDPDRSVKKNENFLRNYSVGID